MVVLHSRMRLRLKRRSRTETANSAHTSRTEIPYHDSTLTPRTELAFITLTSRPDVAYELNLSKRVVGAGSGGAGREGGGRVGKGRGRSLPLRPCVSLSRA
eukprot:2367037-Rhodomonas_salina.2